jgi:AraC-like DNA-binding protein
MDVRIERVIAMIKGDVPKQWKTKHLASEVSLSESRLRHLVFITLGVSVAAFVQRRRLRAARALLERTDLLVKAIAAVVGIADAGRLSKRYRALFGVSPTRHRGLLRLSHVSDDRLTRRSGSSDGVGGRMDVARRARRCWRKAIGQPFPPRVCRCEHRLKQLESDAASTYPLQLV